MISLFVGVEVLVVIMLDCTTFMGAKFCIYE